MLKIKKLCCTLLAIIITVTSLPVMNTSASIPEIEDIVVPPKIAKEDDVYYGDGSFTYEGSEWETKYNTIISKSSDIQDIGRLPDLDEFKALYGYSSPEFMNLTKFRQTYGIGTEFIVPSDVTTIYICNAEELDLLAQLVNYTATDETSVEQSYYSQNKYKLNTNIEYTGTTYIPIGNYDYPFNGEFDGDGWEINNVKLIDNEESSAIYTNVGYLGLFGRIGEQGVVKNLGITGMKIDSLYVLAADVGFICGANYGLIENCFVNSKWTSTIRISNSTAAGIAGENYGKIRSCYADAWVEVPMHSGTYSEPQPITTRNHYDGEELENHTIIHLDEDAVVENCYYINEAWRTLTFPDNLRPSSPYIKDLSTITTNDEMVVGWHYKGDKSQIYGTGLEARDFVANISSYIPTLRKGILQSISVNRDAYGAIFTLKDLRATVGSGAKFSLDNLNYIKFNGDPGDRYVRGTMLLIQNRQEWVTFCKLVNKEEPGETDDEQQFWANMNVRIYPDENCIETMNGVNIRVFDVYQDDPPLGTETYPYKGYLGALNNILIRLNLENRGNGTISSFIGYNKGIIKLSYFTVKGNAIGGYIGKGLLCDINDGTFTIGSSSYGTITPSVLDTSYRVTNDISTGINIYATDSNYSDLANMNYDGITILRKNKSGSFYVNSGIAYQWFTADNLTKPAGYNYLNLAPANAQEGGTIRGGVKLQSGEAITYGNKETVITCFTQVRATDSLANNLYYVKSKPFNYYSIVYPSFSTPVLNGDTYEIRNVKEFIWLLKYSLGYNARLMNTIDMSNNVITGNKYSGYFTMDGTLTDTNDICNNIDLGVTKCYGILGLTLNDSHLSVRSSDNANLINFNNLYFIGGTYIQGNTVGASAFCSTDKRVLAKNLYNVHISMTQIINYRRSESYRNSALAQKADYCSISSRVECNISGHNYYSLSSEANDCVSYAYFVVNSTSNTNGLFSLGDKVNHCINKIRRSYINNFNEIYAAGNTAFGNVVTNSLAPDTYDWSAPGTLHVKLFGCSGNNNTFSGKIYTYRSCQPSDALSLCTNTSYLVLTANSLIDGNIQVFGNNSNCYETIFKGTLNLYLTKGYYSMFETYSYNILSDGVININKDPDTSRYVNLPDSDTIKSKYGITKKCEAGVFQLIGSYNGNVTMNSKINFVDLDDIYFAGAKLCIIDTSKNTFRNYSDISINSKICIPTISIAGSTSNNVTVLNYGNIYLTNGACAELINVAHRGSNASVVRNYGDIYITRAKGDVNVILDNDFRDGDAANFGNFTYQVDDRFYSELTSVNMLKNSRGINYGDIDIDFNNTAFYSGHDLVVLCGNKAETNLGNISIHDINGCSGSSSRDITIYAGSKAMYGNININNINKLSDESAKGINLNIIMLYQYLYRNDSAEALTDKTVKSNVTVNNCDLYSFNYSGMFRSIGTSTYVAGDEEDYIFAGDIELKNITTVDRFNICPGVRYGASSRYHKTLYSNSVSLGTSEYLSTNVNVINNIEIENITSGNYTYYYGISPDVPVYEAGYKHNNATVLFKDCTFKKSFVYSGLVGRATIGKHKEWVNNSDLTIDNCEIKQESYIYGIVSGTAWNSSTTPGSANIEIAPLENVYCFGTMNIDVYGAKVNVAGIGRAGQICIKDVSDNNIVVNACDISVSNDKDIVLCGVVQNDNQHSAVSKVYNAINCGNLSATQTGTGNVYIYGITDKASTVRGVENIGDISTTATKGAIYAIHGDVSNLSTGWVNYGNVSADNFDSSSIVSTVKGSSSTSELCFGINHGTFSKALSSNIGVSKFLVDLSGSNRTVPDCGQTFSTDVSIVGVAGKQGKGFNDFVEVINNTKYEGDDDLINQHITYDDFISTDFGFRYVNPITTNYITSTTKQHYNGANLFDYTDVTSAHGLLLDTIDANNGAGGYTLGFVGQDGKYVLGSALEQLLYKNNEVKSQNEFDWWGDYTVHGETFDDYINNIIKQRNFSSSVKIFDANISSDVKYETVEGSEQYITNISELTPFQAPVPVNGVYSNKLVTIIDLYVLANAYSDIENQTINWQFNINRSSKSRFKGYTTPYTYNTSIEFKAGIENLAVSSVNHGADVDTIPLQLKEIGKTNYAIVGYVESEDYNYYNIVAVRLHTCTTQAMGWLYGFEYAYKTVNDAGYVLDYTQAFKGTKSYYDSVRGTEAYEGDGYTITEGEAEGHTYPIYNMTVPMFHTSNGIKRTDGYDGISSMGEVRIKFDVQNITSYKIVVSGDNIDTYSGTADCPATGMSSNDGTVIMKNNEPVLKDYASNNPFNMRRESDNYVMYMQYGKSTKNRSPFYLGGDKVITVYGTTEDTNEEIILFKVNITKTYSFENYIKDTKNSRYWFGMHDGSTYYEKDSVVGVKEFNVNIVKNIGSSELSSKSNPRQVFSPLRKRGSYTEYPDYMDSMVDVTAENGDTVTYTYRKNFVDFNILDVTSVNGSNCIIKNGIAAMTDSKTFTMWGAYNRNKIEDFYDTNANEYGTEIKMTIEKFDVYIGGEYVRTVTARYKNDDKAAYDSQFGLRCYISWDAPRRLYVYKDDTVPKADLPDEPITIKPYVCYTLQNGDVARFECEGITFIKELNPDRKLVAVTTSHGITSTYISESPEQEAVNVDIDNNHNVIYGVDYTTIPHLYIYDIMEPNREFSNVSYKISSTATLEQYVNGAWTEVFAASEGHDVYNTTYNFTMEGLGQGYTYQYRIVAQDYTTEDAEKATHITYFDHSISAVTRNKKLEVVFKTTDTETMQAYNDIISEQGNITIQIKNMNLDQLKYHQTKFYVGNESLESNYYNLSRGDYSFLVNVPDNYEYQIRIAGTSTEGYLQENPYVRGKRLRLPFANAQTIRLEVTLRQRSTPLEKWGNIRYKSSYKSVTSNNI